MRRIFVQSVVHEALLAFCLMWNVKCPIRLTSSKVNIQIRYLSLRIFFIICKEIFFPKIGSATFFSKNEIVNFFFEILYVGKHNQQLSLAYECAFAPDKSMRQSFLN